MEQPLPKHGACNLSSINLSEYVKDPYTISATFNYDQLGIDIEHIVQAMDDVLEENIPNHALPEQQEMARKYRNIGIGVMGLHDTLIKMGIVYGSRASLLHVNDIMNFIFKQAVCVSAKLGAIRGNFPGYSSKVWDSTIIKNHFTETEIENFKKANTLRNCSLLSIAPTGSIGTMFNISTGVEPFFSDHYFRKTISLNGEETFYPVDVPVIAEAKARGWDQPHLFDTANNISGQKHVDIQVVCQRHVDTAISKTINLPKNATPKEIKELFLSAWEKGCKGLTVYVDGSRDPILSTNVDKSKSEESAIQFDTIKPVTRKELGKKLEGISYKCKNACGGLYIQLNNTKDNKIVEVFANPTSGGGCQANLQALARSVSDELRSGIKVDTVIESLSKVQCQACLRAKAKGEELDGNSCAHILAQCLKDRYNELNHTEMNDNTPEGIECPECHKKHVRKESGCMTCPDCGWSKCN